MAVKVGREKLKMAVKVGKEKLKVPEREIGFLVMMVVPPSFEDQGNNFLSRPSDTNLCICLHLLLY